MNDEEKKKYNELRNKYYAATRKLRNRARIECAKDHVYGTYLITGSAAKLILFKQKEKEKNGVRYSKENIINSLLMELYETKYRCIIERCDDDNKSNAA